MTESSNAAPATEQELVITRTFNAPRDLVWKAWSEAERLAQWWGPKGFALHVARLDFRPNGIFHYRMDSAGGQRMWGRFIYHEIDAPERMVYVSSFSDEEGNITQDPFGLAFPLEIRNTLTLSEEDGRTTLTLRGGPVNATEAERQVFQGMFGSMQQGFKGTLDQLESYLATG